MSNVVPMRKVGPPTCLDCAHHKRSLFGRHWCYGYTYRDPVTGAYRVIPDTCSSAQHTHATPGFGMSRGNFGSCGPEARLFKQR